MNNLAQELEDRKLEDTLLRDIEYCHAKLSVLDAELGEVRIKIRNIGGRV